MEEKRAQAYQLVWDTLRSVDVTGYAETLGRDGTHFVSWSRVWAFVKGAFPSAESSTRMFDAPEGWKGSTDCGRLPFFLMPDGSAAVEVRVSVSALGHIVSAACLHPVGQGMKVTKNPDLAAINKATRRAMVKACALLGLGLELWTDEGRGAATIDPDASRKAAARLRARLTPAAQPEAPAPAPDECQPREPENGRADVPLLHHSGQTLRAAYAHINDALIAVGIDPTNPTALASLAERSAGDGGREVALYEEAQSRGMDPREVVRAKLGPADAEANKCATAAWGEYARPAETSGVRPTLASCTDFFAMLRALLALEAITIKTKEGQK